MPISRSGGGYGPPATAAAAGSYSTSFPLTENPIVEDGGWVGGLTVGLDWQDMKTVSGIAHATAFNDVSQDDSIALRTGINSTRHYAQGTIYVAASYAPSNGHEMELYVGGTITANSITGYEILFSLSGAFQIVRWLGARSNGVTPLTVTDVNGGAAQPTDGMLCRAEYSVSGSNVLINVYQNSVQVATCTDINPGSAYLSGQPGIASFVRSGGGASLTSMGWADFACGTF